MTANWQADRHSYPDTMNVQEVESGSAPNKGVNQENNGAWGAVVEYWEPKRSGRVGLMVQKVLMQMNSSRRKKKKRLQDKETGTDIEKKLAGGPCGGQKSGKEMMIGGDHSGRGAENRGSKESVPLGRGRLRLCAEYVESGIHKWEGQEIMQGQVWQRLRERFF